MPFDGGTAIQEDPDRPAFRGNGPDDYVCVQCGNVLAEAMHRGADDEEGPRPLRSLLDGQRRGDRRPGAQPAPPSRLARPRVSTRKPMPVSSSAMPMTTENSATCWAK